MALRAGTLITSYSTNSSFPIVVEHLSFAYPSRQVLSNVSLSVRRGEIFGLLGPNGSGKTTLFKILSTLLSPLTGTVLANGYNASLAADEVRRHIGVVFQSFALDKKLTVTENLIHQGHLYGLSGESLRERIGQVLERLGLAQRRKERVETLSGGLQRRTEIAKGLLHKPSILILDEPSTGLDPGARKDLWKLLTGLRKEEGTTILLTTHLLDEADHCDRLAVMHQGRIVAIGAPAVLKKDIGGDIVSIVAHSAKSLAKKIKRRFRVQPVLVNDSIHIERKNVHEFIPKLLQAFPREIRSVTIGKPTLEDVFIKHTGHSFSQD